MPTQTTSIFIVLFANGNVDVDSDCDASVGSRIFDIGLVCSDSVPAKTSQWLATLADTRTHTLRQTPRIIVHVYFVCALIFFPCVVTLTTRRMRNVWQIQCEPLLLLLLPLLLPHTLDSYHLCTNVANSAYKCNKVARLPFYLSAPRSFSLLLLGKGELGRGGHKAFPVSELSLTAHSGIHTDTHTYRHACMHMCQVQWDKNKKNVEKRRV